MRGMFIVYACYVNKTRSYAGRFKPGCIETHFSLNQLNSFLFCWWNIFIFDGCKVMFVLKETLESLISFSHVLQEMTQMDRINLVPSISHKQTHAGNNTTSWLSSCNRTLAFSVLRINDARSCLPLILSVYV